MSNFRIVGCGTSSLNQSSVGRMLLSKPHGGALTYLGAENYSYPVVESRILQNEFNNVADSSIFSWGEIFWKSAEEEALSSSTWDISKWVVLSRNFLGDPLLPVRTKSISASDILQITLTDSVARRGKDSIVVTIKDGSGNTVEGVRVGLVSQKSEIKSAIVNDTFHVSNDRPFKDLAFAKGVTNRAGQVTAIIWLQGRISR
jgi:hypothetical protein